MSVRSIPIYKAIYFIFLRNLSRWHSLDDKYFPDGFICYLKAIWPKNNFRPHDDLTWEYCVVFEPDQKTFLAWFCALYRLCFAEHRWFISVWGFVKFSNHNSRTLDEIGLIKVWFEPLSTDHRKLFHEFNPEYDNIDTKENFKILETCCLSFLM